MEPIRTRREPPTFRRATLEGRHELGGRLVDIELRFDDVDWLDDVEPAASVRLLLPDEPGAPLEIPQWNGNEFLRSDGGRPVIRTLTPLEVDDERSVLRVRGAPARLEPAVAVAGGLCPRRRGRSVGTGPWADTRPRRARVGARRRRERRAGHRHAAAGDPSEHATVRVLVEIDATADGRPNLHSHPGASVDWAVSAPGAAPGDTLVQRVTALDLGSDTLLWAAGEAAAMHRIRQGVDRADTSRSLTVVRGYWKVARRG